MLSTKATPMTDDTQTPKDARKLSPAEYKAARAQLVHEAIEAETKARNDRAQAALAAKYKKDSTNA